MISEVAVLDVTSAFVVTEPEASVEVRVIVLEMTVVALVTSGVVTIVDDSVTIDPRDEDVAVSELILVGEGNVVTDVLLPDEPVPRLVCLFSCLINAASISRAGTAVAEMRAQSKNVGIERICIVKGNIRVL